MNVNGTPYRTIWLAEDSCTVRAIDQRWLPHRFCIEDIRSVRDMATAITEMHVRGAGLIGAAAGFGMFLAALAGEDSPEEAAALLLGTRPTAVNLRWAVERMLAVLRDTGDDRVARARAEAMAIADEDAAMCAEIGRHGVDLIRTIHERTGQPVNILTHCNAGWLAFVDHGTATAPIYAAHHAGIPVHVWVGETRPQNQGARLTAWELAGEGVPHTVITDNAGGHLMQHGQVDLVITGSDRTTRTGDVANKIGTYLKALAAHDNGVPFYVALPSSTIDWSLTDGVREIPIEQRHGGEVRCVQGLHDGEIREVLVTPAESATANHAFDVTPARLVTALITERGIVPPEADRILALFPEKKTHEKSLG